MGRGRFGNLAVLERRGAGDLLVAPEALAEPSVRPAIGEGYHALAIASGAVPGKEETAETE